MSETDAMRTVIEAQVADVRRKLANWAAHMAARFGGTVYLVGSTLHNHKPRDCDVRIVIDDHEFSARYGVELKRVEFNEYHPMAKRGLVSGMVVPWDEEPPTQRWIDDVGKLCSQIASRTKLNMDVKVWPESHWRPPYPAPIVLAALSPRWFVYNAHCPAPALGHTEPSHD